MPVCMTFVINKHINAGYPTAERALRGSTNIETLSDEDQQLLRVACKVRLD